MKMSESRVRGDFLSLVEEALRAVDPAAAVAAHVRREGDLLRIGEETIDLRATGRIVVVGGGKGCAPMAAALSDILGERISGGLVAVKYGHTGSSLPKPGFGAGGVPRPPPLPVGTGAVALVEAGHPVPDEAGLAAASRILEAVRGLRAEDLVIVLLSGGGSALLPAPAPGVSLEELRELTTLLLASGADIDELNAVRKHCSILSGGQLARAAAPARIVSLILSDVVGSPLGTVASGPTAPDPTTFADVRAVIDRHGLFRLLPRGVRDRIEKGLAGAVAETPKPGDPLFDRVANLLIGDNPRAARAAAARARALGWNVVELGSRFQGEARTVGRILGGMGLALAAGETGVTLPACYVLGGETTVTLKGGGLGGRNLELALAAALELDQRTGAGTEAAVATLATDGNDGPTDAAGALATSRTIAKARAAGLDARKALDANDSYPFWSRLGDLLLTGPTNTNVNDLAFVFAWESGEGGEPR